MRIIGLCSFFDEAPKMLAAMLSSGSKLPVDHWMILDGAYALYPEAEGSSQIEQHEMIARTCNGMGAGWTIHVPQTPWFGNEVEKRDKLFAYGQQVADPGDWFVVMDADQTFKSVPGDLRSRLETSEHDAGRVTFAEYMPPVTEQQKQFHWEPISRFEIPIFFRAQNEAIRVVRNHFTYETAEGKRLWGHGIRGASGDSADYLDITDVTISHRKHDRTKHRQKGKDDYYGRREELGIETDTCFRCDRPGVHVSHAEIENLGTIDNPQVKAWPVWCCEDCFPTVQAERAAALEAIGAPPNYFEMHPPIGAAA